MSLSYLGRMKHICFFNTTPFWGGGERFYFEMAEAFHQRGIRVSLVCDPESEIARKASGTGIPQFHVRIGNLSFLNLLKLGRISTFFRESEVDLVMFSTSQDLKAGGFAAYAAGVKQIIYRRGLAIPIRNTRINRFLMGQVLTGIIANSEETKRLIRKHLSNVIPESKIKVIYNGIHLPNQPTENFPFIEEHGRGVVIGNAGRLTLQKGQHFLIEIAQELKSQGRTFSIFIAGEGEMREQLQNEIEKHQLQNDVHLIGFVDDINSFMHSIDIFVLTSEWEGFGYVLAEAMIAEKPVIAFDITSNPEVVENHVTGELSPFGDTRHMTDQIMRLMDDEELRLSMGKAGARRVMQYFTFEHQVNAYALYLIGDDVTND